MVLCSRGYSETESKQLAQNWSGQHFESKCSPSISNWTTIKLWNTGRNMTKWFSNYPLLKWTFSPALHQQPECSLSPFHFQIWQISRGLYILVFLGVFGCEIAKLVNTATPIPFTNVPTPVVVRFQSWLEPSIFKSDMLCRVWVCSCSFFYTSHLEWEMKAASKLIRVLLTSPSAKSWPIESLGVVVQINFF